MYRIDSANSVPSIPPPAAPGAAQFFRDGTTGSGDGTELDADMLNMIQESLIEILDFTSTAHSKTDSGKLLEALTTLIDDRLGASAISPSGYIDGLIYMGTAPTTFDISPGGASDSTESQVMLLAATKSKDITVAWDEGTGALASNNSIASAYWGNIFLLGKSGDVTAVNLGVDKDSAAANLLSDAGGAGWDLYRQIGFILYKVLDDGDLDAYYQDPIVPELWRIVDSRATTFNPMGASAEENDVFAPMGTLFYGLHVVELTGTGSVAGQGIVSIGLGSDVSGTDIEMIDLEHRVGIDFVYTTTEPVQLRAGSVQNSARIISGHGPSPPMQGDPEIQHQLAAFWWDRTP